jgi:hypothetical protein
VVSAGVAVLGNTNVREFTLVRYSMRALTVSQALGSCGEASRKDRPAPAKTDVEMGVPGKRRDMAGNTKRGSSTGF